MNHAASALPHDAALGRKPISAVETPISTRVTMSVALRPIRSPQCPKIAAPIGRAANPTKYVANDSSVAT